MMTKFEELCSLLPSDTYWGDVLTPAIVEEIVMAVESREREACAKVCRDLADGCRKVKGPLSADMMQAYEYAEADIRARSNAIVSGLPLGKD